MSQTPQDPSPESTPLPDTDIGDDRGAAPGTGPVADDLPTEGAGDETGGPDTQLSPNKD